MFNNAKLSFLADHKPLDLYAIGPRIVWIFMQENISDPVQPYSEASQAIINESELL